MKTYKLTLATVLALSLIALSAAMLTAAPTDPGKELRQELGNAPIPPRHIVKAHSDEWNDIQFNKNVATDLPFYFEYTSRGQLRGGLAGIRSNKPIAPKLGDKAHSDAWNSKYFDRNVNANLKPSGSEYIDPGLRRGGMAKDAR